MKNRTARTPVPLDIPAIAKRLDDAIANVEKILNRDYRRKLQ